MFDAICRAAQRLAFSITPHRTCAILLRRTSPFGFASPRRRVNSVTMAAQQYRANARQCLSWAESASDPENREASSPSLRPGKRLPTGSRDRPPRRRPWQPANLRSVGQPRVKVPDGPGKGAACTTIRNFRNHGAVHGPFDCRDHPAPPLSVSDQADPRILPDRQPLARRWSTEGRGAAGAGPRWIQ
jgi:hypothetical protein